MSNSQKTLLFDRLEIKYLVDRTTRTALTQDLLAFMRPDRHAGPNGSYLVRSLYFDTPSYSAYHEKMSGAAIRHKIRVRAYGADPSQTPHVRLEVKSRYLNYIHKITVDVSRADYGQIERSLQERTLPPDHLLADPKLSQEFFRLQRQYNMEPKIIVQYRRQALERLEINRVRVNFDDELYATRNLNLLAPLQGARQLLKYGHAILEIKVDQVMPFWLHKLIGKYNLQNQALSKYCYAVQSEGRYSSIGREHRFVN
jgi:SPX domain protein involved in polyphosphate accumulation